MLDNDLDLYNEILQEYKTLTDDNINLAFVLTQKATSHKSRIGALKAHYEKLMLDAKYTSEAVKARLSIDHAPTKPTEGQRFAAKEKEFLDSVQEYTKLKKTYEYLDICYKVLSDCAFQCFQIYNNKERGVK